MPIDTSTARSPVWWLERLRNKLEGRRKRYDKLEAYYSGNHPLPEGDKRCREMFKSFQRKARTNYCEVVADSMREALEVTGFRVGGAGDPGIDRQAWASWQANHLDADSSMLHGAALQLSDAYVIVGPGATADGGPSLITIEDPRQVIIEASPTDRRVPRAALKLWVDDIDKLRHAVVYLPDQIHYFKAPAPDPNTKGAELMPAWELDGDPATNTIGLVPVVRYLAAPRLTGGAGGWEGRAEFENVIDIQDRINDTILNRLVITKMQAYRQRWAKGIATTDEDGNDLELPFVPGVDLLWAVEDPNAAFGDFAETNLQPILEATKEDVKALVMLTAVPPHYIAGEIVNVSGDALVAINDRRFAKARDHQRYLGESHEQVIRLDFAYRNEGDKIGVDAEIIWRDPERKSIAQLADAAVKKQQAGVPWRQNMEDLGYSPQQIDRMESDRVADAALAAAFAPPTPKPPAAGVPAHAG